MHTEHRLQVSVRVPIKCFDTHLLTSKGMMYLSLTEETMERNIVSGTHGSLHNSTGCSPLPG